ncbi:DUF2235 domain-containing protein [Rhizobium halophytocola]|uniref:Uncharacterized protein (DUF2235 family) n=1 Tax=Rhizobium halophytocola TaxID=735519 RepID=A0ABS4DZM7_9HYPH|nr:uncharacterized protein (DUF2235 family) [Rhizobium halophytocola]
MPKNILIFSDGTGQIGGQKPDQLLSNVYKLYRATRPGPESPIRPRDQVAFYDPGLGVGEVDGMTLHRIRNALETTVGAGIDDNVIDCYEAIIANYEPGDRVCIFGFSRGAYTARSVANVMNLCGIPTKMPDGSPVPKYGPELRKIASDAVKYVYNHGAGHERARYEAEREEKARRFRRKYGSCAEGDKADQRGNVQPTFVGVFDTVAALGNRLLNILVPTVFLGLVAFLVVCMIRGWPWYVTGIPAVLVTAALYWLFIILKSQWKYFSPDPEKPLSFSNPLDWPAIWKHGHRAVWSRKHYDKYLDSDVLHARHALSIDEQRKDFDRVPWGSAAEAAKASGRSPEWLKQVWFAGCHSDIGGSYPEPESRLSDISLQWMIDELRECVPGIQIRDEIVVTSPDHAGLQHSEIYMIESLRMKWPVAFRQPGDATLHPTVLARMQAEAVPQMGEVKAYRPASLAQHPEARIFYEDATEIP